jgi:phosphoglycerate dehydrogenase-like enzyme
MAGSGIDRLRQYRREMFRLAVPFGFSRMLAYNPYVDSAVVERCGVTLTALEVVLRQSDIVAVNSC